MPSRNELGQYIATFRGSYRSVKGGLLVIGVILILGTIIGIFMGGSLDNLYKAGPPAFLVIFGLAGLLVLYAYYHSVRIHTNGLEGKNFWGLPVRFYWSEIEGIRFESSSGIPAVVICELHSAREMWILRDVFLRDDFQRIIRQYLHFDEDERQP
jgi:ABC-type dipeptide/oligopeptide/nickel transport system permease subunit